MGPGDAWPGTSGDRTDPPHATHTAQHNRWHRPRTHPLPALIGRHPPPLLSRAPPLSPPLSAPPFTTEPACRAPPPSSPRGAVSYWLEALSVRRLWAGPALPAPGRGWAAKLRCAVALVAEAAAPAPPPLGAPAPPRPEICLSSKPESTSALVLQEGLSASDQKESPVGSPAAPAGSQNCSTAVRRAVKKGSSISTHVMALMQKVTHISTGAPQIPSCRQ
ncbi:SH3 domain-containing protein C23A1.17-like [Calypte anna]|uniref:SH3 domain-containing protein C23A1.17-like n=1 Tax=Calypte anna TaxID=9244 RepID=UPI0011C38BAB|nr:SH3 domain-containing protein C23A1.17-like [Calypte anna]